jgi:hypothetical protein
MRLILEKKTLAGETGVRGFSKPGEGFFFLMKTVGGLTPTCLVFKNCSVFKPVAREEINRFTCIWMQSVVSFYIREKCSTRR